jgi:diketogulonate reductase-like aldo/keto reductase
VTDDPSVELTPLEAVRQATEEKKAAETADQRWRDAIRAAITAGVRVVDIAEAAGVTRDRVYQIRDDRR